MPLQNRVTPQGELVAVAARGTMMGNRGGCFHRRDRTLGRRRWASRQWICCLLEFKDRRRHVMSPGLYTELFFLDEATALAAGHRPCFECRREAALHFAGLWSAIRPHAGHALPSGRIGAPDMDRVLHAERLDPQRAKRTFSARLGDLPDGAMVRTRAGPALVLGGRLLAWSHSGYGPALRHDATARITVLTPPSTIAVLGRGYRPRLHPSAGSR